MCRRPFTSMPTFSSVSISATSAAGSTTTPVPMTAVLRGPQNAARNQLQHVAVFADDDGVAGVVAAGVRARCNRTSRRDSRRLCLCLRHPTARRPLRPISFAGFSFESHVIAKACVASSVWTANCRGKLNDGVTSDPEARRSSDARLVIRSGRSPRIGLSDSIL